MRLLRIWDFAAFFAYFSTVCISHIFPHILAFSVALNILCSNFSDGDDLLLQEVEEVVTGGTEFVEFESGGSYN